MYHVHDDDDVYIAIFNKFPYLSMMMARYVQLVIDSERSLHLIIKLKESKKLKLNAEIACKHSARFLLIYLSIKMIFIHACIVEA